jgi:hypothetical protein
MIDPLTSLKNKNTETTMIILQIIDIFLPILQKEFEKSK